MRTPSMVRLVSAMLVATTTLRLPGRRRPQRGILGRGVEVAEQRQDLQRRIVGAGEHGLVAAPDLAGAGQEHQHVTGIGRERAQ